MPTQSKNNKKTGGSHIHGGVGFVDKAKPHTKTGIWSTSEVNTNEKCNR